MRTRSLVVLSALVLTCAVPAQRGERGGRRPAPPPIELEHFDYREVEFASTNLEGGKGNYGVYLPKGWSDEANADERYPLVVWLHGFGGYQEFQREGGARTLDRLRGEGAVPEMVFVTFRAPGGRRSRSVYVNGDPAGKVEDAIVQDLTAHTVAEFRAAKEARQRALMGISIGGYGALKVAMKHPDVFGVVAAHSAAVFPDDPAKLPREYSRNVERAMRMGLSAVFGDPIDPDKWAAEMPMGLARKAAPGEYAGLRIYFDAGSEDRYGFAEPNEALSALMREREIEHTFRLVDGGGHAWGSDSMLSNLEHSLKFVAAAFATPVTGRSKGKDAVGGDGEAAPGKDPQDR